MATKKIEEIKSKFFDLKDKFDEGNRAAERLNKEKVLRERLASLPEKPEVASDEYWEKSSCERDLKDLEKRYGREGKFTYL